MKMNEKIILCRKKAGLSQMDLADLLGVSRQSVSKWETGEANPDVSNIAALAKALGVTVDWLLNEEETEKENGDTSASKTDGASPPPVSANSAYPSWMEKMPGIIMPLIKKHGWLFGLYIAAGAVRPCSPAAQRLPPPPGVRLPGARFPAQ